MWPTCHGWNRDQTIRFDPNQLSRCSTAATLASDRRRRPLCALGKTGCIGTLRHRCSKGTRSQRSMALVVRPDRPVAGLEASWRLDGAHGRTVALPWTERGHAMTEITNDI